MEGPLAGSEFVGVARAQVESCSSIVQEEAGIAGTQARTDAHEVRLDERDGKAGGVDDRKIGGPARRRRGRGEVAGPARS